MQTNVDGAAREDTQLSKTEQAAEDRKNVVPVLLKQVRRFLPEEAGGKVDLDTEIIDLEIDSLGAFELVFELEEKLVIELDEKDLATVNTLRDLADKCRAAIDRRIDPDREERDGAVPAADRQAEDGTLKIYEEGNTSIWLKESDTERFKVKVDGNEITAAERLSDAITVAGLKFDVIPEHRKPERLSEEVLVRGLLDERRFNKRLVSKNRDLEEEHLDLLERPFRSSADLGDSADSVAPVHFVCAVNGQEISYLEGNFVPWLVTDEVSYQSQYGTLGEALKAAGSDQAAEKVLMEELVRANRENRHLTWHMEDMEGQLGLIKAVRAREGGDKRSKHELEILSCKLAENDHALIELKEDRKDPEKPFKVVVNGISARSDRQLNAVLSWYQFNTSAQDLLVKRLGAALKLGNELRQEMEAQKAAHLEELKEARGQANRARPEKQGRSGDGR